MSAATLSTSSGSEAITLSTAETFSTSWTVRTLPLETTRNATGVTETPAPLPPPNICLLELGPTSEPPDTNPKVTRETGMMVVSSTWIGSPMMVSALTMSRIFSMVTPIRP